MMPSLRPRPLSAVPPTNSNQTPTHGSSVAYWLPAFPAASASTSVPPCSTTLPISWPPPSRRTRWLIQHRRSGLYLGSIHLSHLTWEALPELAFQSTDPTILGRKVRYLVIPTADLQLVPILFTRVATPDGVEWVVDG